MYCMICEGSFTLIVRVVHFGAVHAERCFNSQPTRNFNPHTDTLKKHIKMNIIIWNYTFMIWDFIVLNLSSRDFMVQAKCCLALLFGSHIIFSPFYIFLWRKAIEAHKSDLWIITFLNINHIWIFSTGMHSVWMNPCMTDGKD